MKQLALLNPENSSEEEIRNYSVRKAARAIVMDEDKKIALLYVAKSNYYKLPGGGLENTEKKEIALQRECREEIGSEIEIINEVGSIIEYRKFCKLQQISYCYIAKLKGKKGQPKFTDEEIENGFKQIWLSYEDAKQILTENMTTDFEGKFYIVPRDRIFLEEAKEYLTN